MEFINSVSVDFGVEPGASNCSIGMSIPRHYGDSVFRDGNTLLRPGLEVHVYFRGYFPMKGLGTPNAAPVAGINLKDIPQHPYYPVFHGVIVSATHEYSGGFYTANLSCNGMLHFWESQKMSGAQGGSFFGARPAQSGVQPTLRGHPMTGKSPYSIIYSLYRDTAGVADGVGFALASRTNYGAVNSTTRDPLYALTLRYWEQRFRGQIYGLRMHGVSGRLFTSSQQAYLSLYHVNSQGGSSGTANVSPSTGHPNDDFTAQDTVTLLGLRSVADGRVLRQVDTRFLPADNENASAGVNASQLQAFPSDVGAYGQVNLWESTYESKMDIATAATNVIGYEFYQDADGDLVFKPPLYNLDTSSSRVYRIEPEDIVSINFSENEPAATYCIVKGGAFQNQRGLVDESEFGARATYVDYKLVAQFGWKESSIESTYYNNARSAFYFAINHLDRQNAGTNSATVVIPLRAEIRPGYPVYFPHIDCFYYVTQVSHSLNIGSECTTTLTLTARRRKFIPPGSSVEARNITDNLPQVTLADTNAGLKTLQALDPSGIPRLVGFPNVVMAIDPDRINPMFQAIGFQAVERELNAAGHDPERDHRNTRYRRDFATRFLQLLWEKNIIGIGPPSDSASGNYRNGTWDSNNFGQTFTVAGTSDTVNNLITITLEDLTTSLDAYIENREGLRGTLRILQRQLVEAQNHSTPNEETIRGLQTRIDVIRASFATNTPSTVSFSSYTDQYNHLQAAVGEAQPHHHRAPARNRNPQRPGNIVLISYLIDRYRVSGQQSSDLTTDPSGTVNSSANLLQMLSDRKASLSLTVPGYYRYYSASHPDPAQQGYDNLSREVFLSAQAETVVPTINRTGTARGAAGGYLTGPRTRVDRQLTSMTMTEAAGYIRSAWSRVVGSPIPNAALEILVAQWAHETGSGASMNNFNFGGLKYGNAGLYTDYGTHETVNGERVATHADFQAYRTADEGAAHFVQFVTGRHHITAIRQYLAHPGDAQVYADAMKRTGYFTSDARTYGRDLQARLDGIRNSGVLANAEGGGASDPLNRSQQTGASAHIPDSEVSTVLVRPASNVDGIPDDRKDQYVELIPGHIARKGLRVRVMESAATRVVPTNLIYTMTFEERRRRRVTRGRYPQYSPTNPQQLLQFINSCLSPEAGGAAFVNALAASFQSQLGDAVLAQVRPTPAAVAEFVGLIGEGIEELKNPTSLIGPALSAKIQNIEGGRPNTYNPTSLTSIRNRDQALTMVREKAVALIREVSLGNKESLTQATALLTAQTGPRAEIPAEVTPLTRNWEESLVRLFRGDPLPQTDVFQPQNGVQYREDSHAEISPVFPVSDEKGFEHYGSYQYGRGLSIEPGGNYERLMSTDPLQYVTDAQREAFLRAIRSRDRDRIEHTLQVLARELNSNQGPGAQVALDYAENVTSNGDRTSLIANGLRNYILSDRDSVTKLPVNNVAYQLADLAPMGQSDTCECRGAEADLLLAAYMAGTNAFAYVDSVDDVTSWVSGQMLVASESWSIAQSKMRGISSEAGRRSLLESVEGWENVADSFRTTNTNLGNSISRAATNRNP